MKANRVYSWLMNNLTKSIILLTLCVFSLQCFAQRVHLLIPGGAGGGWDNTARGVGESLSRAGLIEIVSYENMSGGSGSRAISYLIETAERQQNTLMISSSPIILSSLRGIFSQSFRDLTPVAAVVADYGAFAVRHDSPYQDWQSVISSFISDPKSVKVAGGSARGSMDHMVMALAIKASGGDPRKLRYIPYNAGGQAMVGLLSGETQLLSTGLSEALTLAEQGEIRILATTAPTSDVSEIPSLIEQGIDASFVNWRGFFAAPGIPSERVLFFEKHLEAMYSTPQWREISDSRGWTDLFISGNEFVEFLEEQEFELNSLLIDLELKPQSFTEQ